MKQELINKKYIIRAVIENEKEMPIIRTRKSFLENPKKVYWIKTEQNEEKGIRNETKEYFIKDDKVYRKRYILIEFTTGVSIFYYDEHDHNFDELVEQLQDFEEWIVAN